MYVHAVSGAAVETREGRDVEVGVETYASDGSRFSSLSAVRRPVAGALLLSVSATLADGELVDDNA